MKNLSILFLTTTFLLGSCGSEYNFKGQVSGVSSDSLLIFTANVSDGRWTDVDTVPLHEGKFEVKLTDTVPMEIHIAAKRVYGSDDAQVLGDAFFFFPGDCLTLHGTVPGGLVASGTELYDALAKHTKLTDLRKTMWKLEREIDQLDEEKDEVKIDSLWDIYDEYDKCRNQYSIETIRKNPDNLLALYLSLDLFPKEGAEAIGLLPDEFRKGVFSDLLNETMEEYQRDLEISRVGESIHAGSVAPDFTLQGMDGKPVSLAQFHGKYVVLDFWGTWCGWCLAGIPKMKEYYDKYHKDVEFVGICCSDTEKRWKKCVSSNKMAWTQLIDNESTDIALIYAVSGYPTKIIVDPEGKIVEVFEGESQAFYDKLDEMF